MPGSKKIIIAGAGFAGVAAALALAEIGDQTQVILINDTAYHCYNPELYQLVSASVFDESKKEFSKLDSTVNIPLELIFKGKKVKLVIDQIKAIDLATNQLVCKDSGQLNYDFLILCLGSKTNYFNIEGAEKFSHPLKDSFDALNIRNDIEELVRQADRSLSVVVAGGGFTGVELAGSLVKFLEKLASDFGKPICHLQIIEASDHLLSGMPKWAQTQALKRLKKLGVEVLINQPISQVKQGEIESQDGSKLKFDYLIWTTGVRGENLEGQIKGIEFNHKTQIEVGQDLTVKGRSGVFVTGDLSAFEDLKRNLPVPQAAWAAIAQAKVAAENVKRELAGKPLKVYSSQEPIFIVPVGGLFAISNFWIFHISGLLGWGLKRFVTLKYFLSILPVFEAIKLWVRGAKFFLPSDLEN